MKNLRIEPKAIFKKKAFNKVIWAFLFPVFVFLSNAGSFSQTDDYVYQIPKKLNDGWEVSSLSDEGIDKEAIEEISRLIRDIDRYEDVLSMLIVKNGKLVHEVYSPYCQRNTLHWMASITKTITSTLIGIAVDKGFIKNVDTKLYELLPQFAAHFKVPEKRKIALKHIMTMTSGLEWNERVSYNDPRNSEWQMVESEDWMSYVASRPVRDQPGKKFDYNTGGIHLLSAVIKSVSGLYAHQFAEKYLLHPMGIYGYQWNKDPMGYPCTGGTDGGLGLRTRDIAKFGWLFLKDGKWKGKEIVSEKWVKEAPKISLTAHGRGRNYGFNWMTGSRVINGKRLEYIASFGYGGQTLYIVPEYDLIVVFTCELAGGDSGVDDLVRRTFEAAIQK
ncbi:MAG: serine hydrolase [Candidatus Aminicenantes bacterium]|nr:serine hydrolase [Candidatus Aminicenantes bacterium]